MTSALIGIGLIFGLLAALVANSRGANPIIWYIFGFFLGPFGVAAAFFSDPRKRCPRCAEMVKTEAAKCRYCGTDFANTSTRSAEKTSSEQ